MAKNKAPRDRNAPKRNLSAYLLYQNAMRNTFKAQNPAMTFGQLAKYTSAMYAELSPQEKEAWQARAEADKNRFLLEMASYVPPPGYDARGEAVVADAMAGQRSRAPRDSNAPKRNLSAYLLYQNAMRDQFKADNPGMTFGQLSKYTSHMYKTLSAEERAEWNQRAQQDKDRYTEQMRNYLPPPGHDAQGKLIQIRSTVKRMKKTKDPNAPKRARGSYVFFTFEMRPKIMAASPNVKFTEMGSIMGERWRALSNEEKLKYEDMAKEDKDRFNKEMQAYTAQKAEEVARTQAEMAQQQQHQQQHYMQGVMPQPHHVPVPQYQMPPQSYTEQQPQPIYDHNHYNYT